MNTEYKPRHRTPPRHTPTHTIMQQQCHVLNDMVCVSVWVYVWVYLCVCAYSM